MHRSSAKRLSAFIVSVSLVSILTLAGGLSAATQPPAGKKVVKPTVIHAQRVGISPPMRTMKTVKPTNANPQNLRPIPNPALPKRGAPNAPIGQTKNVQRTMGHSAIPEPITSFDGVSDVDGVQPADTTMDVSPDQILQWVNLSWSVYDKSGNQLGGPFEGNSFWSDLGGVCANNNGGDILVRWDQFANQWWVSQLAYPGGADGFHQCIAVSTSSDALGTYYQYDFLYSPTDLNDYPKLGMWPVPGGAAGASVINDGFYVSVNNFVNDQFFGSAKIMAFDRQAQLSGSPGVMQIYDVGLINSNLGVMLPADLRGTTLPASGSMQTYVSQGAPDLDGSSGPVVHVFQSFTDFTNPDNSFLVQLDDIPVDPFDWASVNGDVAPQVGGGGLEVLNDRPMYRADYRVFSDHDALVFLHDVNVGTSTPVSGERWYELRGVAAGTPTLFQSGTYGPDDSTWRWMGSIAQDVSGDISMGFSATSDGSGIVPDPSVHYTGRLVSDPPGTMTQGEDTYIDSSQPFGGFRWGDYSTVVVDPVDQCTFWYTTMYGAGDWATRIGSFKFSSCTLGPSGTLSGTVSDGTNPIPGAKVTAGASSTLTDASGGYSFTLPVGTYSMTATKYGFLPASANGVAVTDGGTTNQNFVLTAAPSVVVNGTVKDGSGANWPLYAKVVISAPGAPTFTLYTDPVTGYYSQTLVQGIVWSFAVTAPGYIPGGGPVPLTPAQPIVLNWTLNVDVVACNAPGYSPSTTPFLSEGFDGGVLPPGWSVTNNGSGGNGTYPIDWQIYSTSPCGDSSGNLTGGDGFFAMANSNCPGSTDFEDTSLITPSMDLSSAASAVIRFNQDYNNLFDTADVDVSVDGGSSWSNVLRQTASARGPQQVTANASALAAGQADVKFRFHYYNAFFAWWWQVDNVLVFEADCSPQPGGLVVGNVRDGNTGKGINGATVTNVGGGSTKTVATPADPNLDDGFYILFAPSGQQAFQASQNFYATQQQNAVVVPNSSQRLDFTLAAGSLSVSPSTLTSRVDPGATDNQTLSIMNSGHAPGTFHIRELNVPASTTPIRRGPFADPAKVKAALERIPADFARQEKSDPHKVLPPLSPAPQPAKPFTAGDILNHFPLSPPLVDPWGVGFNTDADDLWISDIGGSAQIDYRYLTDGTQTADQLNVTSVAQGNFALQQTYNSRTKTFWQSFGFFTPVCLFEYDPATKALTGNSICPAGLPALTGVGYDWQTDTYYLTDVSSTVTHIDPSGNILDSAFLGILGTGPAYNPTTGHLFVLQQTGGGGDDVYVYDTKNNYNLLGSFNIGGGGVFSIFAGGMQFDCEGHLWAIDQANGLYEVDSGEAMVCPFISKIPWVSENPTDGTVPAVTGNGASNPFPVDVTFDSTGLLPGLRQAQLTIGTDTPVPVSPVPLNFTVRFLDVPDNNQFQAFIYGAAGAGVMMGGPPVCTNVLSFCPTGIVTRADMAGYLFRAAHGVNTPPPVYQNTFADVSFNDYNAFYIQGIFDDGITGGCSANPRLYCPSFPVTRAQMAVFVWKDQHGSEAPPACTPPGVFLDVPCPDAFAVDYIEGIYHEGVTAGCGGGNFCPHGPITNGQMAVFMVKAFNIPYLP